MAKKKKVKSEEEKVQMKEVSFVEAVKRLVVKYQRLFPTLKVFYKGAEVVNATTGQVGVVRVMSLDSVTMTHLDGTESTVPINDVISAEVYWKIVSTLPIIYIRYKGKETPTVLVSAGTFILPCPKIFEEYANMLSFPHRDKLYGVAHERYYEHLRKFLKQISWNDMKPEEIDALNEKELEDIVEGKQSEDPKTGRPIRLPPELNLEKAIERIREIYEVTPCKECTVSLTCDCRMRIAEQITGEKAWSYRLAQNNFRVAASLMSFLLRGIFRGRPRVRLVDYDVWLRERLAEDYDKRWVQMLISAIGDRPISSEVKSVLTQMAEIFEMSVEGLVVENQVK